MRQVKFSANVNRYCFLLLLLIVGCNSGDKEISPNELDLETTFTDLAQLPPSEIAPAPINETESPNLNEIRYKCLEAKSTSFFSHPSNGALVLHDAQDTLVFFDLKTGEEKKITLDNIGSYSVSPEGNFLAVFSFAIEPSYIQSINVFNSSGNFIAETQKKERWHGLEWLDEENLVINYPAENNSLVLFSPFKGTQKVIQPYLDPPNLFTITELLYEWGFYAYHKNVYDSRLERAIYPSVDENGQKVILRDIVVGKDLGAFSTNAAWGISPKWSPDGKNIAIGINTNTLVRTNNINKFEIVVIGRDGEKVFVTNLSSLAESVNITSLAWSPDSRYIAFWYTTNSKNVDENLELAVLDTKTKVITNYCIMNTIRKIYSERNDFSPIWSPDSSFLLIKSTLSENQTPTILILDITNGYASPINSDLVPVGWLK